MEREQAPSEASAPKFILMSLLLGGIAAVLLGAVYGWLSAVNPIIYLNLLGVFVLGGAVGLAVHATADSCGIRGPGLILGMSLLLGVVGLYIAYVVWTKNVLSIAFNSEGQNPYLWRPGEIWQWLQTFAENGLWSIGSIEPKGAMLWAIWGAEALGIVGTAVTVGLNGLPEGD